MNWICGLKRLWVLASIAFTVLAGAMMAGSTVGIWHLLLSTAMLSAAVSIPTLIIGAAIIWVVRGFRREVRS